MKTEEIIKILKVIPNSIKFNYRKDLYNYLVDNYNFELTLKAFLHRIDDYPELKEAVNELKKVQINGTTIKTLTKESLSIDNIYDSIVSEYDRNQKIEDIKQTQEIKFSQKKIAIVHISCPHLSTSNIKKLFSDTEKILKSPNMYVTVIGDLTDNFINDWTLKINLNRTISMPDELTLTKFWLNKIKNKLLLYVEGNHDLWTQQLTGNSFIYEYLKDSNFHVLYDKHEIPVKVNVNGYATNWIFRHSFKGNTNKNPFSGSKNYIMSYPQKDFDFAVSGHIHSGSLINQFMFGDKIRTTLLVNTYKEHDDYGKELGATPINKEPIMISLIDSETNTIINTTNLDFAVNWLK